MAHTASRQCRDDAEVWLRTLDYHLIAHNWLGTGDTDLPGITFVARKRTRRLREVIKEAVARFPLPDTTDERIDESVEPDA